MTFTCVFLLCWFTHGSAYEKVSGEELSISWDSVAPNVPVIKRCRDRPKLFSLSWSHRGAETSLKEGTLRSTKLQQLGLFTSTDLNGVVQFYLKGKVQLIPDLTEKKVIWQSFIIPEFSGVASVPQSETSKAAGANPMVFVLLKIATR